mmetsp:Transcript_5515/g.12227  ORF Transcript_5515/g.12227 Transcript_5515/m.12227 type:complete len:95 (+) Transcript_5515:702-986(+)
MKGTVSLVHETSDSKIVGSSCVTVAVGMSCVGAMGIAAGTVIIVAVRVRMTAIGVRAIRIFAFFSMITTTPSSGSCSTTFSVLMVIVTAIVSVL